jgi:hypothetical protein
MSKRLQLIAISATIIILSACGGDDNSQPALPTQITLPELTPSQEILTNAEPQQAPSNTPQPLQRPTLPPTFTPTLSPSATPQILTNTPQASQPNNTQPSSQLNALPESCTTFGPITANSDNEFQFGESPSIEWGDVLEASLYRLFIVDDQDNIIHEKLVEDNFYLVPAEVFSAPGRYGWEVEPLDSLGIQICFGRGASFIAR